MKIATNITATLLISVGIVIGGVFSDYATINRFPYKGYIVEIDLSHEKNSDFMCSKYGAILGSDVSGYNSETGQRKGCTLLVAGEIQTDGTLVAYPNTFTWKGRIIDSVQSVHLSSSMIKSIKEY
jgi:hypothetical protein